MTSEQLADMLIKDVISSHPDAAVVFEKHGLGCASCLAAGMESVSDVAAVHDVSLEVLLGELGALYRDDEPGREL
jgi:hybrid cluster-associated redox disulfide protein